MVKGDRNDRNKRGTERIMGPAKQSHKMFHTMVYNHLQMTGMLTQDTG